MRPKETISAAAVRLALVFPLFVAVTAVLFAPMLSRLGSALIGPPEDNMIDLWNSWYAAVAAKPHGFFFTDLIRYPEGMDLHYHTFAFPQVFSVVLLTALFGAGHLVLFQNLTLLAAFPLAGLGAYLLVRHVTGNDIAALVGAFVFAFNPSHFQHALHHANVESIEFIPFFVLAYLLALERRSYVWLALSAVFWALNGLACLYYLFYAGFFVVFHTIYLMVREKSFPAGWKLFVPVASAAGAALLMSPILIPMLGETGNPATYDVGANTFVVDLVAPFLFPPTHILGWWTGKIYDGFTGNPWESTVYLGLVNLALLVFLCVRARKSEDPILRYTLWGMGVFLVLAAGDCLHVLGRLVEFVPLPGVLISKLPILANLRAPSRLIVLVYLFLAIAVASAVAHLLKNPRTRSANAMLAIVALLVVLDFYPVHHLSMTPVACPAGLSVVRDDPDKMFGVLDLPDGHAEGGYSMMMQRCHGRPIAQGTVARQLYPTLANRLAPNLREQRDQLERAKIKYIVLHKPWRKLFDWPGTGPSRAAYAAAFPVAYDGPQITVLRVY